ncbi:helix-turn-helix domain-containing protein [Nocardioides panacis]|uniref:Helix-turn-helix domain-containing protein n=1 Tax=Nocardioides panacis TaxID=2849501 RepID=A0A975XZJ4_9ACTN|nr:helix-turn-helix transcriptional regulator [Nocardioides panacis]QWZ07475.1 helix-turn-helix domain-containing protein [Nocardioides panacis]
MSSTIGTRIRDLRQSKGLTQQALAGDGISSGYVSLIESGKRTPSDDVVRRLAKRLGVPVEALVVADQPSADADQARMEMNFARMALANGDSAQAVRGLQSLPLDQMDSRTALDAALVLAEALAQTGELTQAVGTLESIIARCRREQSWVTLATASASLVMMYVESGDSDRACLTAEAAVDEIVVAGLEGTDEHIRLGAVLVWACYERGDLLYATRRAEELIEVADRLGSSRARGAIYWNASMVAHGRGRVTDALRLSERALALVAEEESGRDLPRLRLHYAWLLLNNDSPQAREALAQLDRAESDPAILGDKFDLGNAATMRGRAHLFLDELDDAAEQAARALQLLGPSDHINRAEALLLLGDVGAARGDDDLRNEAYGEMELVLSTMEQSRMVARMWRALGDALRESGDALGSIGAYDRALGMIGMPRRARSRMRHLINT